MLNSIQSNSQNAKPAFGMSYSLRGTAKKASQDILEVTNNPQVMEKMSDNAHYVFAGGKKDTSLLVFAYKEGSKLSNKLKNLLLPMKERTPLGVSNVNSYHSPKEMAEGLEKATKELETDIAGKAADKAAVKAERQENKTRKRQKFIAWPAARSGGGKKNSTFSSSPFRSR